MTGRELRDALTVLDDDQLDSPVKVLPLDAGHGILQDVVEVDVEDHLPDVDSTGVGTTTIWLRTEAE